MVEQTVSQQLAEDAELIQENMRQVLRDWSGPIAGADYTANMIAAGQLLWEISGGLEVHRLESEKETRRLRSVTAS